MAWSRWPKRSFKKKPVARESADQSAVVAWARGSSAAFPGAELLFAIPNGHGVHISIRLKMVREGLLSGVPDLFLPVPKMLYHGLFIEMKRPGNTTTENQDEVQMRLEENNYKVVTCYTPEKAIEELKNYLSGKN